MVAFCAVSMVSLVELRRDRWDQAVQGSTNLLTALSQDISRNVRSYDRSLQTVAARYRDPKVARLDSDLQQTVLFDGSSQADYLGSILILDASGNVVKDAGRNPPRQDNFQDRSYFQVHRDRADIGLYISPPFIRRLTGHDSVIALSRRLSNDDGSFAGVVVGTMRLAFFQDLFDRAHLRADDAISLFLNPGILVLRSPYKVDAVGRDLSQTANVQTFMRQTAGIFSGASAVDGVRRVYNFTHIHGLPMVLNVALSEKDIFAVWRVRAATIGGALLLCCLLTVALVVFLRHEARKRHAAEAIVRGSEAQYRLLADHATDVIMKLDRDLVRRYVSPAARLVLGYEPDQLLGERTRDIIHAEDWPLVEGMAREARTSGATTEATYRLRHQAGHHVWIEGRYRYVPADDVFIVVLRDVSRRKEAERQLAAANRELGELAHSDALTGLANRRRFDGAIRSELRRAERQQVPTSVLLMDVDRFKAYNDRYGHPAGDECLRAIGTAIRGCVEGSGDLAARYGGEEFVVLLPATDEAAAALVAERIRAAVESIDVAHADNADHGGRATISIGCATGGMDGTDVDTATEALLATADRFLYEAKRLGRNQVVCERAEADGLSRTDAPSERERLSTLDAYRNLGIVDPCEDFDRVARLAADLLGTRSAFLTFVERDEVVAVGTHNIEPGRAPRSESFCTHTIAGRMPMVVSDARADARFADAPLTQGSEGIRFYAGAPLIDPRSDRALGALCVLDPRANAVTDVARIRMLGELARIVSEGLARRRDAASRQTDPAGTDGVLMLGADDLDPPSRGVISRTAG